MSGRAGAGTCRRDRRRQSWMRRRSSSSSSRGTEFIGGLFAPLSIRGTLEAMIILLNGPLGIGKSTLAEALSESIPQCVMLDGDALIAANPEPVDPLEHLHSTL